jgi:hypothetical protein
MMTLKDELAVIDETIAELEGRRTEIIHKMGSAIRVASAGNLLEFPNQSDVVVTRSKTRNPIW